MKHSEVRNHIVETASSLFYNKGYNLTGINEIISEAGIAKATLYNHFKSKEDICVSYLQYKNTSFLEKIKEHCSSQNPGKDQVLGVLTFLQLFYNDSNFNGCWCINTISEIPKENQKIRLEIQKQKQEFIDYIQELIQKNRSNTSEKEKELISKQIYVLYEGAVAESHLHQNDWPIHSAIDVCHKIIE